MIQIYTQVSMVAYSQEELIVKNIHIKVAKKTSGENFNEPQFPHLKINRIVLLKVMLQAGHENVQVDIIKVEFSQP